MDPTDSLGRRKIRYLPLTAQRVKVASEGLGIEDSRLLVGRVGRHRSTLVNQGDDRLIEESSTSIHILHTQTQRKGRSAQQGVWTKRSGDTGLERRTCRTNGDTNDLVSLFLHFRDHRVVLTGHDIAGGGKWRNAKCELVRFGEFEPELLLGFNDSPRMIPSSQICSCRQSVVFLTASDRR